MEQNKERLINVQEEKVSGGKTKEIPVITKVPVCYVCGCTSTEENPIIRHIKHSRNSTGLSYTVTYQDTRYICSKCDSEPDKQNKLNA